MPHPPRHSEQVQRQQILLEPGTDALEKLAASLEPAVKTVEENQDGTSHLTPSATLLQAQGQSSGMLASKRLGSRCDSLGSCRSQNTLASKRSGLTGQLSSVVKGGAQMIRRSRGSLSEATSAKVQELFSKIDVDGSDEITHEEALRHFKGKFGRLSVDAMFNKADLNKNKGISGKEFHDYWNQVKANGYSEEDIIDEIDGMLDGAAWTGFSDKRKLCRMETKSAKNLSVAEPAMKCCFAFPRMRGA